VTVCLVVVAGIDIARGNRSIAFLKDILIDPAINLPLVSVVVPARNEEKKIRLALESLLRLEYAEIEFIVLNDRSTDLTSEILKEMAAEEPRLQVSNITELPAGWLGKNYALHRGAERAKGELLLFTDADVVMESSTISRAVNYLRANQLDHLAVMPRVRMPSLALRLFCSTFGIFFSAFIKPWKAKDPKSAEFIGIGAFNLIRREVYQAVGGHQAIAMRPDDDVKLGKLLKKRGYRQEMVVGLELVTVEWYSSIRELIDGLMKNFFAGLDYNVPISVASGLAVLYFNVWPFAAIFLLSGKARFLSLCAAVVLILFIADANHLYGLPLWYAVAHPLSALLFVYILWKSMLVTLWTGGIKWRGTHYPLALLRSNRV